MSTEEDAEPSREPERRSRACLKWTIFRRRPVTAVVRPPKCRTQSTPYKGLAMLISELMYAEFPNEIAMTRSLLARISDDILAWKPAGELHTVAWNATHLVEILGWVPGIIGQDEFDIAPVGGEPYVTPEVTQVSQLLSTFDASSKAAIDSLAGVPDSVMHEPWSLKMGGQTLFTMNKGDCIRKWVFSHTAHHRGILSAYLRMTGLQFPSIYEE